MNWIKVGSLLMLTGVALGAFGAHALKARLSDYQLDVYKTAVLYQLVHALGILLVGVLSFHYSDPKLNWAAVFLTAGVVLFSGSLYVLSITGLKWLGMITPLGGLSFLLGWIFIFLSKTPGQ